MASLSHSLLFPITTALLLAPMTGADAASAAGQPVAAASRQQRPAVAPSLKQFAHTDAWRAQALRGVSQPYPASLKFLDNQGAWYTPFDRPGMPGPYDPRGLHNAADSGVKKR